MGGSRSGDGYRQGVAKQESSSVGNGQEVLGAGQGECPARWWSTRGSEGSRQQGPREGGSRGGEGRETQSAGWTTYGWVSGAGRWALGICFAISRKGVCRVGCRLSVVVSLEEMAININFPRLINKLAAMGTATGTALQLGAAPATRPNKPQHTLRVSSRTPPRRALACLTP